MRELLQRHWIKIWWSVSAGLTFLIGCLAKILIREPPFTDWAYIVMITITMPSLLIPVSLYMLRNGSGTKP